MVAPVQLSRALITIAEIRRFLSTRDSRILCELGSLPSGGLEMT
jgi:hypothetical protein